MDPRRILLKTDPGNPYIGSLIRHIPGAREVLVSGDSIPDLPGIRITRLDETKTDASKTLQRATLVIAERDPGLPIDLLLVPDTVRDDQRTLTDQILILVGQDQASHAEITMFLDRVDATELILVTEGDMVPDIPLHIPHTIHSYGEGKESAQEAVFGALSGAEPTLVMLPSRSFGIDPMTILECGVPVFLPYRGSGQTAIRELRAEEFQDANSVWVDYHETTGNPRTDRIFAASEGEEIVSLARCRRHPDGFEVDAVFTPEQHRGRGLSRQVMTALVEACYNEELTMYAVTHLEKFYAEYGFVPIPEKELPASVRKRYLWATGNLEGAGVLPMKRAPARPALLSRDDSHK